MEIFEIQVSVHPQISIVYHEKSGIIVLECLRVSSCTKQWIVCSRDRRDQKFWYDIDTDTFAGSKSIPRLILILGIGLNRDRYWYWYQENVPGLILIPRLYLIRNPFMSNMIWSNGLHRDWYWYPDSNMSRIDTDTKGLGIGLFDSIPIFPSVSALKCWHKHN